MDVIKLSFFHITVFLCRQIIEANVLRLPKKASLVSNSKGQYQQEYSLYCQLCHIGYDPSSVGRINFNISRQSHAVIYNDIYFADLFLFSRHLYVCLLK